MSSGIRDFPHDVTLGDNFKLLEAEFGLKGYAILFKLHEAIYASGYYMQWSIDVGWLFTREKCPQVGCELVSEIVASAVRRGLFSKEMYTRYSILTSKRIQEVYFFATKRRKQVEIDERFLLPVAYKFLSNVDKSCEIVNTNGEIVNSFRQRKEEERIGKENKEEKKQQPAASLSDTEVYKSISNLYPKMTVTGNEPMGNIDTELLLKKVGESEFLQTRPLRWLIKYWDKVKTDYYATFKSGGVFLQTSHNYTVEELNAIYDDIDDIVI